ncbi:MAG: nucleotidyl transferase AbiEii/AbiGii toxin family protein, partial [Candidatus Pacebacteria bacterium]|nr:nucleotidyl transferase AbiEii/AbiGii toxin family protein [Candidatus Paceibacterota bacterium]
MEEAKTFLKNLIDNSVSTSDVFKRNILKEYLQILVLDFIYSHPKYSELCFYGGSALKHCFDLPRLSEDLDFVDLKSSIKLDLLAFDLEKYFKKNTDLDVVASVQKFRVYLKFPILRELKLAKIGESDLLFLKVEIFNGFDFCRKYKTEFMPLFKFNKSILVKIFDLPTLMSTKIRAVLYRKWEKKDKKGDVLIKVKGRDYFDLMWYLEKGIKPNIECLDGIKNSEELKEKLLEIVEKVDAKSIELDLEP